MDTKITLVITAFVAAVVIGAATMVAKPVYAPSSCASCGALFAPGQLKISQPAVGIGILARELGQPASQLAPGQLAKDLNSPG